MRNLFLILTLLALVVAACGDDNPPPTQIVLVVTATPESDAPAPTDVPPTTAPTMTVPPTVPPDTAAPSPPTSPPSATPRPDIFPTNVSAAVPIAEQVFEQGRMVWLSHNRQIWVMVAAPDNPKAGDWFCYNDTFVDGEQEMDPSLIPPEERYQPRRGFGKLWRTHPDLREALGWGLTPEFDLTSSYTYIAGGYVENSQYVPGPGEHRLTTLYNENISFYEADIRGDCLGGTWRMGGG